VLSVADARERILAKFSPLGTVNVPLAQAIGRVLADEIIAKYDLPPFRNASMDGFAICSSDLSGISRENPVKLQVVADIPAGQVAPVKVLHGQAARIMTGAPVPEESDAVIPVEDTDFNQRQSGLDAPEWVEAYKEMVPGENIRPQGQDVHKGEGVMLPGRRIRAQDVGFLAMLGVAQVPVYRSPRVAIFSTGDELIQVDTPLIAGKIHDSNTYTLIALVEQYGGIPLNLGIVPDRAEAVKERLDLANAEEADLILSSAGVSVGAFDFVRSVVEQYGQLSFWRVNMRPGKPLAVGEYLGIPFVGLPGNPVSAFVGFEVFVRPAILKMAGVSSLDRITQTVFLSEPVESDGRESYLRANVEIQDGQLTAYLTGHQGSGNLRSLVQANALLLIPSGVKSLPAGTEVTAWFLGEVFLD
jgi:molybdopterin molybdotransferase